MLSVVKKLAALLSKKDKIKMAVLLLPMSFTALMNVIGIGFIMPFVAVVSDPTTIQKHRSIRIFYNHFHFANSNHFLVFLGIVLFVLLLLINFTGALTAWLMVRMSCSIRGKVSHNLLKGYLNQPYSFFLKNNTASLSQNIFDLTSRVIYGSFLAMMYVLSDSLGIFFILALLLYINPVLAAMVALIIGGVYGTIYFVMREKITEYNKRAILEGENSFKLVNEVLGGIKDLKLLGNEKNYLKWFFSQQQAIVSADSLTQVIQQVPRYALEVVAFGSILLLVVYLLITNHNPSSLMSILALYAFAGYRLMPLLQKSFSYAALLKATIPALNKLVDSVKEQNVVAEVKESFEPLAFKKSISLNNICFHYDNYTSNVIDNLTLEIPVNSFVGFIGSTGAGKTTLIDIILGLLTPQRGNMLIDGVPIAHDNMKCWQRKIGYVSQHIFLADTTVARNIAFGLGEGEFDQQAVERAAKIAAIHNFIVNELPDGYNTIVGERGIRLSGGQRQRIGIARALYHNPDVLILDEATSSLDGMTENTVMEAINALAHQKTIIAIAHRLSTVSNCDIVYLLEQGRLKDMGQFRELVSRHETLQKISNIT